MVTQRSVGRTSSEPRSRSKLPVCGLEPTPGQKWLPTEWLLALAAGPSLKGGGADPLEGPDVLRCRCSDSSVCTDAAQVPSDPRGVGRPAERPRPPQAAGPSALCSLSPRPASHLKHRSSQMFRRVCTAAAFRTCLPSRVGRFCLVLFLFSIGGKTDQWEFVWPK